MRFLNNLKFSMPNTGLMFLIAGMAVGNYSYENYQRKYMSSSYPSQSVDKTAEEIHSELMGSATDGFTPYNGEAEGFGGKTAGNINVSVDDNSYLKRNPPKGYDQGEEEVRGDVIAEEGLNDEDSIQVPAKRDSNDKLHKKSATGRKLAGRKDDGRQRQQQ